MGNQTAARDQMIRNAALALVPPVLGVLAAFVAAVLIAMEAVGRIGL